MDLSRCLLLVLATALSFNKVAALSGLADSYSAVVVEYSPPLNSSLDSRTNLLNNVANYVTVIQIASDQAMVDIIVFPESALVGYINQAEYLEVPDPTDRVLPCANATSHPALVQLSCAANTSQVYVVVNLLEKVYNATQQKYVYHNTDVVFDPDGVIIGRYRKIHLYAVNGMEPGDQLFFFDTDFGVRFGVFTCFDIIFKKPGVQLAKQSNVSHFIFPTAWFSESPFLLAIQEQMYWSYTQDVVLLASGYNLPAVGSTGTGIYLGKHGPALYNMTETRQSFMLQAIVPKNLSVLDDGRSINISRMNLPFITTEADSSIAFAGKNYSGNSLYLKSDFFDVYTTEMIEPTKNETEIFTNTTGVYYPHTVETTICQNSLCCDFYINVTYKLSESKPIILKGNDFSQLYYRLAVFDGVKSYDGVDTGGIQTCAIIPCVNKQLSSCARRSDNSSAVPNTMLGYYQTGYIFETISISGNFSNNDSFVGPNVLLKGEEDEYGSLLLPEHFVFTEVAGSNDTVIKKFYTKVPLPGLVEASIYGRIFARDGEPRTKPIPNKASRGFKLPWEVLLLAISTRSLV